MYDDPKRIRVHEVKLRFSEIENQIIDQVVAQIGEQRAALLRQMVLREARYILEQDAIREAALREVAEGGF